MFEKSSSRLISSHPLFPFLCTISRIPALFVVNFFWAGGSRPKPRLFNKFGLLTSALIRSIILDSYAHERASRDIYVELIARGLYGEVFSHDGYQNNNSRKQQLYPQTLAACESSASNQHNCANCVYRQSPLKTQDEAVVLEETATRRRVKRSVGTQPVFQIGGGYKEEGVSSLTRYG